MLAGKVRPLLISLQNSEIKKNLFKNLSKLQDAPEKLKKIQVSHDMTRTEREETKKMIQEARKQTEENEEILSLRSEAHLGPEGL